MKKKASVFRRLPILLAMIMLLISCTGCGERYKIEYGFRDGLELYSITIGIRSKTDTFTKDNMSFDLYYSFYENGDEMPKSMYSTSDPRWEGANIIFGIYIYDKKYLNTVGVSSDAIYSDYRELEHHTFIKEISEDEAFSGKYGYSSSFWSGHDYNYEGETICIPAEFLNVGTGNYGGFVISIIAFLEPLNEKDGYRIIEIGSAQLSYLGIDENTVRITTITH